MSNIEQINCKEILDNAGQELRKLNGMTLDILEVKKPKSIESAIQLSKVVSKLSPLMGNMIEFSTVDILNENANTEIGRWIRQDPDFPDALFKANFDIPKTGIEIKAWFPLATEITARFKDSVTMFENSFINVALIAWLPEYIFFGNAKIIDVLIISGKSVAEARDRHYHNPPYYVIEEPQDTSMRTDNLQQTNTNGYKLQEDKCNIEDAKKLVNTFGSNFLTYSPDISYQQKVQQLTAQFPYRLDTNYAKIDRIEHSQIEQFKTKVDNTVFKGNTIKEWRKLLSDKTPIDILRQEIARNLL